MIYNCYVPKTHPGGRQRRAFLECSVVMKANNKQLFTLERTNRINDCHVNPLYWCDVMNKEKNHLQRYAKKTWGRNKAEQSIKYDQFSIIAKSSMVLKNIQALIVLCQLKW